MCRNDVSCYFTDQNELVNSFQIYKDVRYLFLNTLVEPTSTREFCALKSLLCPLAWCWWRCTKRLHICNVSWEKSGYVYCGYHNDEKFPRMFTNEMKRDLHSWQFFASALPDSAWVQHRKSSTGRWDGEIWLAQKTKRKHAHAKKILCHHQKILGV